MVLVSCDGWRSLLCQENGKNKILGKEITCASLCMESPGSESVIKFISPFLCAVQRML